MKLFYSSLKSCLKCEHGFSVLAARPLKSAFHFYFVVWTIVGFIVGLLLFTSLTIFVRNYGDQIAKDIEGVYPAGMELTLDKGKLSVNMPQPVTISYPAFLRDNAGPEIKKVSSVSFIQKERKATTVLNDKDNVPFMFSIDARDKFPKDEPLPNAMIYVFADRMVSPGSDFRSVSVTMFENSTTTSILTEEKFDKAIEGATKYINNTPYYSLVSVILLSYVLMLALSLYLLIPATVLFFLYKNVLPGGDGFAHAYKVSLYASIWPILLWIPLTFLGMNQLPLTFAVLVIAFVWFSSPQKVAKTE